MEYQSKIAPVPSFDIRKAFMNFAIETKGKTVKQVVKTIEDKMNNVEITPSDSECLNIIKSKFREHCKKNMLSSDLKGECIVSRLHIKTYFQNLLLQHKVLQYKIEDQTPKMQDQNIAKVIENMSRHYRLEYPESYDRNEHEGRNIFVQLLRSNNYMTDIDSTFPQIDIYPYISKDMVDGDICEAKSYKTKLLKYYNDFTVPTSYDGMSLNIIVPDSKSDFIDNNALKQNFTILSRRFSSEIILATKFNSDKNLKQLMRDHCYTTKPGYEMPKQVNVGQRSVNQYLAEIGYHERGIFRCMCRKIEKGLNKKIFTMDGRTINPEFFTTYSMDNITLNNFKRYCKDNEQRMINTHIDAFMQLMVKDLKEMYYLDEPGYKLPRAINNEFYRNSLKRYYFDKKSYMKNMIKINKGKKEMNSDYIARKMPFNELAFFKASKSEQAYRNYDTQGQSWEKLPPVEVTDVRAHNIGLILNVQRSIRPGSARSYADEHYIKHRADQLETSRSL